MSYCQTSQHVLTMKMMMILMTISSIFDAGQNRRLYCLMSEACGSNHSTRKANLGSSACAIVDINTTLVDDKVVGANGECYVDLAHCDVDED